MRHGLRGCSSKISLVIMMTSYRARANGEYKSAGERAVADGLCRLGLNFSYEYPWAVLVQGKPRIFYPDFTLKDYGVVIEYAGMQGHQDYDRIMARKEWIYKTASIPVIVVRPNDLKNEWQHSLLGKLEQLCYQRQHLLETAADGYRNKTKLIPSPIRLPSVSRQYDQRKSPELH